MYAFFPLVSFSNAVKYSSPTFYESLLLSHFLCQKSWPIMSWYVVFRECAGWDREREGGERGVIQFSAEGAQNRGGEKEGGGTEVGRTTCTTWYIQGVVTGGGTQRDDNLLFSFSCLFSLERAKGERNERERGAKGRWWCRPTPLEKVPPRSVAAKAAEDVLLLLVVVVGEKGPLPSLAPGEKGGGRRRRKA